MKRFIVFVAVFVAYLSANFEINAQALTGREIDKGTETKKGSWLKFYGFLRLDAIYSDSITGPIGLTPNGLQITMWIESEDPSKRKKDNEQFTLHPRLTRLGFDFTGPEDVIGTADLIGNLEVDFQNGGSESRQIIRIRHAYLQLKSDQSFLLVAGQTWDIISPLFPFVNNDTLMWNAGNLGDRRPQIRLAYEPALGTGTLSLIGGLGLGGAIDNQDLDSNTVRDAEDWGLPHIQGRIAYSVPLWVEKKRAMLGLWGHGGRQETEKPVAGKDEFDTNSVGLDLSLPLTGILTLKGEIWQGENLADYRGGIGQGVNKTAGKEIESKGGWGELHGQLSPSLGLAVGYTLDNPEDEDVPDEGRIKNRSVYLGGRWTQKNFTIGLDYINWSTDWKNLAKGDANRYNLIFQYDF